jgi:hypothetical protein
LARPFATIPTAAKNVAPRRNKNSYPSLPRHVSPWRGFFNFQSTRMMPLIPIED